MSSRGIVGKTGVLVFKCETCGATMTTTFAQARRSPTLQCPNGHEVNIDDSELRRARDVERRMSGDPRGGGGAG
jgi:hypothetical protein